jgi:CheY-like chemotaxis protein
MNQSMAGRSILVVEDEMMVLMTIEGMLEDLGCEDVTVAATIEQALALIAAQSFDVAMLDVNLNGTKSYPVADALAAHAVPFVFSTGYCDVGATSAHKHRPVLNKPFQHEKLGATLSALLAH